MEEKKKLVPNDSQLSRYDADESQQLPKNELEKHLDKVIPDIESNQMKSSNKKSG
jgi:hypothetical protein